MNKKEAHIQNDTGEGTSLHPYTDSTIECGEYSEKS